MVFSLLRQRTLSDLSRLHSFSLLHSGLLGFFVVVCLLVSAPPCSKKNVKPFPRNTALGEIKRQSSREASGSKGKYWAAGRGEGLVRKFGKPQPKALLLLLGHRKDLP